MINVSRRYLTSNRLITLLKNREHGLVDFLLVDVREWQEWGNEYIEGTDYLIPYSNFLYNIRKLKDFKDKTVILYCSTGKKSLRALESMQVMGFKEVINLHGGIEKYNGLKIYP